MNDKKNLTLCAVIGKSPKLKIIEFMIDSGTDKSSGVLFSLSELAIKSNVGYSTLKLIIPELLYHGILEVGIRIGKIKLYRIVNNNIVMYLRDIKKELINIRGISSK